MIVRVGRLGVEVGSDAALADARATFERHHCVVLPGFVEPALLAGIQRQLAAASFTRFVHGDVGPDVSELVLDDARLMGQLQFLFNDQRLFDVVHRITEQSGVVCYASRVYQMVPGKGHHDDWHDDLTGHDAAAQRLVAMSVNLSDAVYEGGVLQIMDWAEQRVVHEVANTGAGDAILFALSDRLKHRLTDVTGTATKMALAGWFQTAPAYRDLVRAASQVSAG